MELSPDTFTGTTVLLVDDDEDSRFVYGIGLEHAGFRVFLAADGEAGLSMARERRPDAVILDMELPLLSGGDVMRRLRAESGGRSPVLVAITARSLQDNGAGLLADGFDRVLLKPVEPAELVANVLRALAERHAAEAAKSAVQGDARRPTSAI